jgi:hypothetical protein
MDQMKYSWYGAYFAAMCEKDTERLSGRIFEAVTAIEQRCLDPVEIGSEEDWAIKIAQKGLEGLRLGRNATVKSVSA